MMSEPVVTFAQLRRLGYCSPRILAWCREHKISVRRFRVGVPVSEIRATGCAFAIKAAELAEQEADQ